MNFEDKLVKYAKSGSILRSVGAFLKKPEGAAAVVAGTSALGAGFIDTRKKIDTSKAPKINPYWDEVKRISQPGDILVGANRPPSVSAYLKGFRSYYQKNLASGMSKGDARRDALKNIKLTSIPAKMYNPIHSHLEMIGVGDQGFYTGAYTKRITKDTLPKNEAEYRKFKERGLDPSYLLLRKKNLKEDLLYRTYKEQGPEAAKKLVNRLTLKPKNYATGLSVLEGAKRTILPRFQYKGPEKLREKTQIAAGIKNYKSGMCSTTAAMLSTKTIAGKDIKAVMPQDPLYSKDYEVVARVGNERHMPLATKGIFSSWRGIAKGTAAVAAGGAAYGITRGVRAMMKNPVAKKSFAKLV